MKGAIRKDSDWDSTLGATVLDSRSLGLRMRWGEAVRGAHQLLILPTSHPTKEQLQAEVCTRR